MLDDIRAHYTTLDNHYDNVSCDVIIKLQAFSNFITMWRQIKHYIFFALRMKYLACVGNYDPVLTLENLWNWNYVYKTDIKKTSTTHPVYDVTLWHHKTTLGIKNDIGGHYKTLDYIGWHYNALERKLKGLWRLWHHTPTSYYDIMKQPLVHRMTLDDIRRHLITLDDITTRWSLRDKIGYVKCDIILWRHTKTS